MNLYVQEVCCDICGGEGMTTPRDAASRWLGGQIRHRDPRVCAAFLRRKKMELEEREKSYANVDKRVEEQALTR